MSGHNTLAEINQNFETFGAMNGKGLLLKTGNPDSSDIGFGTGALCIRTDCTAGKGGTSTALWVNLGDAVTPNWNAFYIVS